MNVLKSVPPKKKLRERFEVERINRDTNALRQLLEFHSVQHNLFVALQSALWNYNERATYASSRGEEVSASQQAGYGNIATEIVVLDSLHPQASSKSHIHFFDERLKHRGEERTG